MNSSWGNCAVQFTDRRNYNMFIVVNTAAKLNYRQFYVYARKERNFAQSAFVFRSKIPVCPFYTRNTGWLFVNRWDLIATFYCTRVGFTVNNVLSWAGSGETNAQTLKMPKTTWQYGRSNLLLSAWRKNKHSGIPNVMLWKTQNNKTERISAGYPANFPNYKRVSFALFQSGDVCVGGVFTGGCECGETDGLQKVKSVSNWTIKGWFQKRVCQWNVTRKTKISITRDCCLCCHSSCPQLSLSSWIYLKVPTKPTKGHLSFQWCPPHNRVSPENTNVERKVA